MILGIGIVVVIIIVIFGGYAIVDPVGFDKLFPEPPPNVAFFPIPTLSESDVKEGRTTILSVVARNNENQETVTNIVVKLSVIKGENSEEHLVFNEITKISDSLTAGDVSDTKDISIRAIKLSGEDTKFRMKLELIVNGISTKTHEFDIKIVPNN